MRLLLLSAAGFLDVMLGAGMIGPGRFAPWDRLLRLGLAGVAALAAGMLLSDAFARGAARREPFGVFPRGEARWGFLGVFALAAAALMAAGSAGLKPGLFVAVSVFGMLASGGALWRTDVPDALAWGMVHGGLVLAGAALFPEFGYRLGEMRFWKPAALASLAAVLGCLLGKGAGEGGSGRRPAGWTAAAALAALLAVSAYASERLDVSAAVVWAAVAVISLEQSVTALRRRAATAEWMARRLSLVLPCGVGGAVLAGREGMAGIWGVGLAGGFVLLSLAVLLYAGPPGMKTGGGGWSRGGAV